MDEWVGRSLFEGPCERVRREIDVGGTPVRHSDLGPVYLFLMLLTYASSEGTVTVNVTSATLPILILSHTGHI